jgi:cytidylate kinase
MCRIEAGRCRNCEHQSDRDGRRKSGAVKVITFDGPSGVGKSEVAQQVATRLGLPFFSIGMAYRGAALLAMAGHDPEDAAWELDLHPGGREGAARVFHRGRSLNDQLYTTPGLDRRAAELGGNPAVSRAVSSQLRRLAQRTDGLVLEGRAAKHIVDENLVAFFCWADAHLRYRRSLAFARATGLDVSAAQLEADLRDRDLADFSRSHEPLRYGGDMIFWDSSQAGSAAETVTAMSPWIQGRLTATVVIPVRDRLADLALALSALRSSGSDFEVIVVDDGSQEDSSKVARRYADQCLRSKRRGPSAARNLGLQAASGDVVIFLDADMVAPKGFVNAHLALHRSFYPLVVGGSRRHLNRDGSGPGRRDSREVILDRHSYACAVLGKPWSLSYSCNLSTPRYLAQSVGGFDEAFVGWGLEDLEFAYRCHLAGARFAYSRDCGASHLWHDRSLTSHRYREWLANLRVFRSRHPSAEIADLERLAPAFDPDRRRDFMACFEDFNGPSQGEGTVIEAADSDPLATIQDGFFAGVLRGPATVVDRHDRFDLGHRLTALGLLPLRFFTGSDWKRLNRSRHESLVEVVA